LRQLVARDRAFATSLQLDLTSPINRAKVPVPRPEVRHAYLGVTVTIGSHPMTYQPPPTPREGGRFTRSASKRWITQHKVLSCVGVVLALVMISSVANAASGGGKTAAPKKVAASSSPAMRAAALKAAALKAAAVKEAAVEAAAVKEAAVEAAAVEAAAIKEAAVKAAAVKAAAVKAAAVKAAAVKAAAVKAAAVKAAAAKAARDQAARDQAAKATTAPPASTPTDCTPGYDPCIPPGSDVDCAGGSGNGPRYVQGPVMVSGDDPYGLDADHNGIGCQS
jgi:hypothetical protein